MKEINNFLDSELVRRSQQWKRLQIPLIKAIPDEFRDFVSYATLVDGKLTIFTESPGWTSRLRFHETEIIENFAAEGETVTEVSARTVPKTEARPPLEQP